MSQYKLGRLPRTYKPTINLSALISGKDMPKVPDKIDYLSKLTQYPSNFGMMLNDALGDCTCAAMYHARQVWDGVSKAFVTFDADADVLATYEGACGYNPTDPTTDQGGNEQDVLGYWHKTGIGIGKYGVTSDQLTAFVEVDVRNLDDIRRVIWECGVAYIGFDVPKYLMADAIPYVWEVQDYDTGIEGGHAIILAGYDENYFDLISWGKHYRMSTAFFSAYTDEAYALIDKDWLTETGNTVVGLSLAELQALLPAIKKTGKPHLAMGDSFTISSTNNYPH